MQTYMKHICKLNVYDTYIFVYLCLCNVKYIYIFYNNKYKKCKCCTNIQTWNMSDNDTFLSVICL